MPTDPTPPGEPVPGQTVFVYDALGRLTRVYDPPGPVTFTTYVGDAGDDPPAPGTGAPPDEDPPDEPHVVG